MLESALNKTAKNMTPPLEKKPAVLVGKLTKTDPFIKLMKTEAKSVANRYALSPHIR